MTQPIGRVVEFEISLLQPLPQSIFKIITERKKEGRTLTLSEAQRWPVADREAIDQLLALDLIKMASDPSSQDVPPQVGYVPKTTAKTAHRPSERRAGAPSEHANTEKPSIPMAAAAPNQTFEAASP
jgi:hypothetical protein